MQVKFFRSICTAAAVFLRQSNVLSHRVFTSTAPSSPPPAQNNNREIKMCARTCVCAHIYAELMLQTHMPQLMLDACTQGVLCTRYVIYAGAHAGDIYAGAHARGVETNR
jgi:hypothetical protein